MKLIIFAILGFLISIILLEIGMPRIILIGCCLVGLVGRVTFNYFKFTGKL